MLRHLSVPFGMLLYNSTRASYHTNESMSFIVSCFNVEIVFGLLLISPFYLRSKS